VCGQESANPGLQSAKATKLFMVKVYICGALVWTVFHVIVLAPINLRCLQDFWKIYVILGMDIITYRILVSLERP